MKKCSICNKEKELDSFYSRKGSKDGKEGICKSCRDVKRRTNPAFEESRRKAWQKMDTKRKGKRWGYHLSKTYGLSEAQYYTMLEEQNYACAICSLPVDEEEHYGKFVVDHCHNTGKVRGLLCNKCNLMLGNAKDDIRIMEAGIEYLKVNG